MVNSPSAPTASDSRSTIDPISSALPSSDSRRLMFSGPHRDAMSAGADCPTGRRAIRMFVTQSGLRL
ncbi:hypothetical protein Cob_v004816 [Colletotrichum orbiculare MAFF 240422]|uniref:Uncharacterized protein n=1 Tax=Colletotrichum orbiculare (strain 104-T / ATCC 96160 / CBS 514.97 / LARS 414 / MAFF 240422) TaxID=1213857 RepID=A0A484FVV2_COLOR|nr:hypothetical protein Cob_v004816 [Colletotrichum orbiculare MAFF 240422]